MDVWSSYRNRGETGNRPTSHYSVSSGVFDNSLQLLFSYVAGMFQIFVKVHMIPN